MKKPWVCERTGDFWVMRGNKPIEGPFPDLHEAMKALGRWPS